jgi:hypothetical protein
VLLLLTPVLLLLLLLLSCSWIKDVKFLNSDTGGAS